MTPLKPHFKVLSGRVNVTHVEAGVVSVSRGRLLPDSVRTLSFFGENDGDALQLGHVAAHAVVEDALEEAAGHSSGSHREGGTRVLAQTASKLLDVCG